ncbi:hydroxyethylthiazole kinase [Paenibacillus barcinonensis]|uniref:Hydroxyethylthiazole kinase n=1 Tax=Paenibacillus barcinonensis TaxID=198119 RepID=A0A2V4URJ7_PAEBA|nr:hydroxyethylthiazole kinase [Paenibacillus barcinonensis]PYE42713.1 hydroxyethylthiazole kinase [Paenibacillus barcinonensis]QKS58561.1 hydroxyethylthiazole kinase [Paenibacillus barcinonensis]
MSYLERVRALNPLVHNITNLVVAPFTANGLLALGASPFMAYAQEEVADVARIAGAVVLNIGTLDEKVVHSIRLAGQSANANHVPVVLDPVGAGATAYRTETVQQLVRDLRLTVLRGNVAEVAHVIGVPWTIKGVDAGAGEGDRISIAERAAQQLECIVVITGQYDIITDGYQTFIASNGHVLLTQVTGAGCLLSSVVGAFAAVAQPGDDLLSSIAQAVSFYGVAAEQAAALTAQLGPGSFQIELLNQLAKVTPELLSAHAQIRQIRGGVR